MDITLRVPPHVAHGPLVCHLVQSYARWWGLSFQVETGTEGRWVLEGKRRIALQVNPAHLVPGSVETLSVRCGSSTIALPYPGTERPLISASGLLPAQLPGDLLCFLAGQLWRAEEHLLHLQASALEAQHKGFLGDRYSFFDRPIVDLWMRSLFENLLDAPLQYPLAWQDPGIQGSRAVRPRYWLSYDIDCLRKWKACTWLRHFLAMPRFVLQGRLWRWLMLVAEAWRSRRPEQDPWYMIPFMLQALRNEHATFFFLGHPSDHKSYRYDIRRKEYARLAQRVLVHHHQVGLHGSPLHATRKDALAVEKSVLEQVVEQPIAVHRQHYLRVQPGVTIPYLDQLGFHYDSSLGFNTRTGFRCGSCTPIPWWDFASNKALQIQEIPLIAGDWTLHNPEHFDESQTRHRLRELALQVQLAGGILALDFHEIYFSKDYPGHAELHQRLLEGLKDYGWAGWLPQ